MAEGESKAGRKTLEMSIWFIILLLAVVIFTSIIFTLNKKIEGLNATIETQKADIVRLEKKNSNSSQMVLDLVKQHYDNVGDKELYIEELESLIEGLRQKVDSYENPPIEEISGEEVVE